MPLRRRTVTGLKVTNLFGHLSPELTFRDDGITILTGPNGSGKTHILRLLRSVISLELRTLLGAPIEGLELQFSNEDRLVISRADGDGGGLEVIGYHGPRTVGRATVNPLTTPEQPVEFPPWVEPIGAELLYDKDVGDTVTPTEAWRRYYRPPARVSVIDENPWLGEFASPRPTFIRTGRLDALPRAAPPGPTRTGARRPARTAPAIERYVAQIQREVERASATSLSVSQRLDRRFAARALDKARAAVKEVDLRTQYQSLADLHHELHENGLTEETIAIALPDTKLVPTERRIMSVFLDDWRAKLEPLLPVHQQLNLLRRIVGTKMRDKTLTIGAGGEIAFRSVTGEDIPVRLLSSGEQHLVALFSMLLFSADAGGLLLIDEPEISLHAAWKHAFVDDLQMVAGLRPIQVIMATHSSALINDRWDLVEELSL